MDRILLAVHRFLLFFSSTLAVPHAFPLGVFPIDLFPNIVYCGLCDLQ